MTYLVSVKIANEEFEVYTSAASEAAAIEAVKKTLTTKQARWASVFIG